MARGNGYRPAELASSRVFSGIIVVFIIALGLATCLSEVGWVAAASTLWSLPGHPAPEPLHHNGVAGILVALSGRKQGPELGRHRNGVAAEVIAVGRDKGTLTARVTVTVTLIVKRTM